VLVSLKKSSAFIGQRASSSELMKISGEAKLCWADVDRVVTMAQSDDNKAGLRQQTEQAKALGFFGSPTFIVGDELFWEMIVLKMPWIFCWHFQMSRIGANSS
jgi:hypothetical protein